MVPFKLLPQMKSPQQIQMQANVALSSVQQRVCLHQKVAMGNWVRYS